MDKDKSYLITETKVYFGVCDRSTTTTLGIIVGEDNAIKYLEKLAEQNNFSDKVGLGWEVNSYKVGDVGHYFKAELLKNCTISE